MKGVFKKETSFKKGVDGVVKGMTTGVDDFVDAFSAGVAVAEEVLPPPPLVHLDLRKQNKKLLNFYEDLSAAPVDQTHFYQTYLARHKKSGEYRSIRKVPKKGFPPGEFKKEVEAFEKMYHPNVMHLYETLEDRTHYYFVTDRLDLPNLYQAIPKQFPNPQDFDETQVALVVRTGLRALDFCHKNKFPHTDLHYRNIIVPPKRGLKGLYIVGFGYARQHERNSAYHVEMDDLDGSFVNDDSTNKEAAAGANQLGPQDMFAAPETRWGELSVFEAPSDIWSLGIISYQLLTRHHPYEDPKVRPKKFEDKAWREDHFRNHPFLENVSAPGRDFLKQMLTYKDFERPTAVEALQHEWIEIAGKVGKRGKKEEMLDCLENLANFDAQNKLEESARLYMATNLLERKERTSLDKIFKHLDHDKKDGLTKDALRTAFLRAHGTGQSVKIEKMLESTFERLDTEKKGVINYNRFLAAAANDSVLLTKKNLRAAFDAFDKGKTGTLTVDDLKDLFNEGQQFKLMARRDAKRVIRQVDRDDCGEISFDDFCDLMLRKDY